jgi:hypothetical protein
MFGVAGFAAATDCFYFAVMAEYFMVAGYNFNSAVNNTAYTADYFYFVVDRRLHRCLFKLKEKEPCCYVSSPS